LLASTGVAGDPESYFRQQDEPSWAARWGISDSDGTFEDVVAQAVSWLRAEQTQVWVAQRDEPQGEPHFEFDRLREMRRIIDNHNAAWQTWFTAVGAETHRVTYEDLDRDPVGVTRRVLDFLGLELPAGRTVQVRHCRLRDRRNAEWVQRYIEREAGHNR